MCSPKQKKNDKRIKICRYLLKNSEKIPVSSIIKNNADFVV